jgi:hypothetical protein
MSRKRKPVSRVPVSTPQLGVADRGKLIEPAVLPDPFDSTAPSPDQPRPMPAPGTPLSDEEYDRLKKKAATKPNPPGGSAQSDPSAGK